MDIYLYVERDSPVHRLDPRSKLICFLGVTLIAVSFDHPLYPGILLALVLLSVQAAGVWRAMRRVRTLIMILSLFSFGSWLLFADGPTPLLGPIELEPVLYGLGTALKLSGTVAGCVVFLATTRNEEITTGLIRMGLPYNVAFAFSTALRLVPAFVGAGGTIVQAQKSRGLDVESGSLLQRMRKYLPLILPVFATAIRSTNRLAMALEAKGFGARQDRTYFLQLHMRPADWVLVGLGIALMALSFAVRLTDFGRIPGLVR